MRNTFRPTLGTLLVFIFSHHALIVSANGGSHFIEGSPSNYEYISSSFLHRRSSLLQKLRAGSQTPNSRSFWSNPQSPPQNPTSFQQQQFRDEEVKVTDVTNELKDDEREVTKEAIDSFLTRENRNSFISRVYMILSGQLLMVAASIFLFAKYPVMTRFMLTRGRFVPWASIMVSTITVAIMSLIERARRVAPLKWQLLSMFSIAEAIIVGFISSFYKSKTVLSAAMSTAVATMSVSMYTILNKDSKRDLSQWGAGLSSMGMIFVFYGIINLLSNGGILPPEFLPYNEQLYCVFGTSLFSMYLAYHTRLIVSGKHSKYRLNDKDYVFGAVLLYNDIINIFLYLLRILAVDERD